MMVRFLAAVTICLLAPGAVARGALTGLVVGVTDGDTITLLDDAKQQHKIRLDGIDAPESAQPFGNATQNDAIGVMVSSAGGGGAIHDADG